MFSVVIVFSVVVLTEVAFRVVTERLVEDVVEDVLFREAVDVAVLRDVVLVVVAFAVMFCGASSRRAAAVCTEGDESEPAWLAEPGA